MSLAIRVILLIGLLFGLAFGEPHPGVFVPSISKMTGTTVDPFGATIPNAKVTLYRITEALIVDANAKVMVRRNTEKEPVAVTYTDPKGEFQFLIGEDRLFKVIVEAACFKPATVEGIRRKWDGSMKLPPITLQEQSAPSCVM